MTWLELLLAPLSFDAGMACALNVTNTNIATITANSVNPFCMVTSLFSDVASNSSLMHYFFCCRAAALGRE